MDFLDSAQEPTNLSLFKILQGAHSVASRKQLGAFGQSFLRIAILHNLRMNKPFLASEAQVANAVSVSFRASLHCVSETAISVHDTDSDTSDCRVNRAFAKRMTGRPHFATRRFKVV